MSAVRSVVFYYDIVCPFAYMASHLVESIVTRAGGKVVWTPVLLAGLYKETDAPQGTGSATDVMAPAKLNIVNQDLRRQLYRNGVTMNIPHKHPQKTLHAMRILAGVGDHTIRIKLSKAFFKAYWQDGVDMESLHELQMMTSLYAGGINIHDMATSETSSQQLRTNTSTAASRGAFGVPSFYVNDQLVWGTDRLFFVERYLGRTSAEPERLMSPPYQGGSAKLSFYFDFSSPWAYLGYEQLDRMVRSVHPMKVEVELVPILLGALFKNIGTNFVPMETMSPAKQRYGLMELTRYAKEVVDTNIQWPDKFPLRTVLPLRVAIASGCDRHIITTIYRAAWQQNKNIGDPEVLAGVLSDGGLPADDLIQHTQSQEVKDQLFANTARAEKEGLCGVPSYQVNHGPIIWGQDKLNIVADMLCGWRDDTATAFKL